MKTPTTPSPAELHKLIAEKWGEELKINKELVESYHKSMRRLNHHDHNEDPDYIKYILDPLTTNPEFWRGKNALDFGCGCGRNMKNLMDSAPFGRVDGCDLSLQNALYAKQWSTTASFRATTPSGLLAQATIPRAPEPSWDPPLKQECETWEVDGYTLHPIPSEKYDLVMSHLVFQHIGNWEIRYSILTEIHRVLRDKGMINVHFLKLGEPGVKYHACQSPVQRRARVTVEGWSLEGSIATPVGPVDEIYIQPGFSIEDKQYIIDDLESIGFKDVKCEERVDPFSSTPCYYARGIK